MTGNALPRWDLSDLYDGEDCARLSKDKALISQKSAQFLQDYEGNIAETDNAVLLVSAIKNYEQLEEAMGRIGSYADLLFSVKGTDSSIAAFCQNLNDFLTEQSAHLLFFTLELNKIDDATFNTMYDDASLAHYKPWIDDVRSFRPYQLNEQLEKLLLDKSATANSSWVRLYEDISNTLEIPVDDESLSLPQALDLLSHKEAGTRKNAALALSNIFDKHQDRFALIYNTVIKDKAVNDNWRGFSRPVSSRNVANLIEDDIVDTLCNTVTARFGELSERYYAIKAQILRQNRLHYWDRNAPYPQENDSEIAWEEAQDIVLQAYRDFSPEVAAQAQKFFDNDWIDAPVEQGKTSGAFSHPVTPGAHPYILLNYQGKTRDVMTLAHELGHGVHQLLAAGQGALMADTPLTLAETASVFGEQLTFQYLLKREKEADKRRVLIAYKIEDMLNTVTRQVAFHNFETRIHDARAQGELPANAISDIWMETQAQSFGDAIILDDSYRPFWCYISHFVHAPFYVYAYAFGDCLVNSLYAVYEEEQKAGRADDFVTRYITMLSAGGSQRHKELLAPFGLDIAQPDFWNKGLDHISSMIDMIEA